MSLVRAVLRTFKLIGYFLRFGAELLIRRPPTRPARADWLHRFCAAALRGMDIPVTVEGTFPARGALITNHTGYLDIVVLAATHSCVFVSKEEIRKWPVIGWFATLAGTVFVERGRGGSALRARTGLQAASDSGVPVAFFPEGTTTGGDTLLPFHAGLLAQVLDAGQPVTAGFLSFTLDDIPRQPNLPGVSIEKDVAYWGDAKLLPHIFRFLGLRGVHAHLRIAGAPIAFTSDNQHRKTSAKEARAAVLALSPKLLTCSPRTNQMEPDRPVAVT